MAVACRIRGVKALWNNWEGPGLPGGHPFMPQKALTPRIGDGGAGYEYECQSLVVFERAVRLLDSFNSSLLHSQTKAMFPVESKSL